MKVISIPFRSCIWLASLMPVLPLFAGENALPDVAPPEVVPGIVMWDVVSTAYPNLVQAVISVDDGAPLTWRIADGSPSQARLVPHLYQDMTSRVVEVTCSVPGTVYVQAMRNATAQHKASEWSNAYPFRFTGDPVGFGTVSLKSADPFSPTRTPVGLRYAVTANAMGNGNFFIVRSSHPLDIGDPVTGLDAVPVNEGVSTANFTATTCPYEFVGLAWSPDWHDGKVVDFARIQVIPPATAAAALPTTITQLSDYGIAAFSLQSLYPSATTWVVFTSSGGASWSSPTVTAVGSKVLQIRLSEALAGFPVHNDTVHAVVMTTLWPGKDAVVVSDSVLTLDVNDTVDVHMNTL